MRVAFVLPGLGRVQRGAEAAFLEVARGLSRYPDVSVELFGSGLAGTDGLKTHVVPCTPRERFEGWPRLPGLRSETYYEELTFAAGLLASRVYRPERFDFAVTCSYPYVNWALRWESRLHGPLQVFVTQNGDWPCRRTNAEYRYFGCDGLVCINPEYHARHKDAYRTALIPNGVNPDVFRPLRPGDARPSDIPAGHRVALMVSAMIPSKRVAEGVRAAARVPGLFLLIAGDGPLRGEVARLAAELLPGRHRLLGSVPRERMPDIFRQADVFLHMSQDEPFGIVYLEAAASGLAVVGHDAPVTRWILGETGFYADTSDLDAAAGTIRAALAAGQAGRDAARERILREWTWARQAARYRDFMAGLATATKGRVSA